jgi:hypothetical protein
VGVADVVQQPRGGSRVSAVKGEQQRSGNKGRATEGSGGQEDQLLSKQPAVYNIVFSQYSECMHMHYYLLMLDYLERLHASKLSKAS